MLPKTTALGFFLIFEVFGMDGLVYFLYLSL